MTSLSHRLLLAVTAAAVIPLSSCGIASDHFSCTIPVGGMLTQCTDFEQVGIQYRATVEAICRGFGGNFTIDPKCPQEGKLGGCKTEGNGYIQLKWFYPYKEIQTAADAKGKCQGKEYFIDPSGNRVQ